MRYTVRLHFPASNNMAEYEALLSGLRIAIQLGIKRLDVRGDSQLIMDQVMKEASYHNDKMEAYCNTVRRLKDKFDRLIKPSIDFKNPAEAIEAAPEPSGAATAKPSAKDPSAKESEAMDTEAETSSVDKAEAMEIDEAPTSRDWRAQYLD